MTTATLEKSATPTAHAAAPTPGTGATAPTRLTAPKIILLGFDLGTNKSCALAGPPGGTEITVSKVVPTVVGYVKDGIVDGIIAGNAQILYGEEALRNMLHVRLVAPVAEGIIADPGVARDFLRHIRSLVDPSDQASLVHRPVARRVRGAALSVYRRLRGGN